MRRAKSRPRLRTVKPPRQRPSEFIRNLDVLHFLAWIATFLSLAVLVVWTLVDPDGNVPAGVVCLICFFLAVTLRTIVALAKAPE
jgi:hypothetical protein